jgi:N-acetylmuramoyl-L-alanine amidase
MVVTAVLAAVCLLGGVGLLGTTAWQALARSRTAAPAAPADAEPAGAPSSGPATSTVTTGTSATPTAGTTPLAGRVVVLDPAHDRGDDVGHAADLARTVPGAAGPVPCGTPQAYAQDGYPESTVVWRVATSLRGRLQALGARVVLTRPSESGRGPCVDARARTARQAGADLLLSLHADGAAPGFVVVAPGPVRGRPDAPVQRSAALSVAARDALLRVGVPVATPAGGDGLETRTGVALLELSTVPAVLVQTGDLADPTDAARLTSGAGQELVAAALAAAVVADLR